MGFPKRSSKSGFCGRSKDEGPAIMARSRRLVEPFDSQMGLAVGLPANRTVRGAKKSLTIRHRRSRDSSEFLAWLHSELLRAGCAPWVMSPYASFHRCRIQDKG